MLIERRLVAVEGFARDFSQQAARIETATHDIRTKFDALLTALSGEEGRS